MVQKPDALPDNVKSSLERFVDNSTESEREQFHESEDIEELYSETGQMPDPRPSGTHIEYMLQYIENEYRTK